MVTGSMFNTEGPQILGATIYNLLALANWRPGFVHPWAIDFRYLAPTPKWITKV